jgi:hypothetical protein
LNLARVSQNYFLSSVTKRYRGEELSLTEATLSSFDTFKQQGNNFRCSQSILFQSIQMHEPPQKNNVLAIN